MSITMEEFIGKLREAQDRYPSDAEAALRKGANFMTKAIRKATPVGDTSHPKKLNKSWRCSIKGYRADDIHAEIRSTAPHYHLVERGVRNPKDSHGNLHPEWTSAMNKHIGFLEDAVHENWDEAKSKMEETFFKRVRDNFD